MDLLFNISYFVLVFTLFFTYKSIKRYMLSMLVIFILMLPIIWFAFAYGRGGPVISSIFLWHSAIYVGFFSLVLFYDSVQYFIQKNSTSFFKRNGSTLIQFSISLVIFLMFVSTNYTYDYLEKWKRDNIPRIHHFFQESSTFNRQYYGNDVLVEGTEELTIIDMHTHMNPNVWKKDAAIYFLANDNTVYKSFNDKTEAVVNITELNNTSQFLFDYEPDNIVVYDTNGYAAYYTFSYKNYKSIFDKKETKRINSELYPGHIERDMLLSYKDQYDLIPKIIKNKKELHFKDATPFKVKYEPKLALKIDKTGYGGDMGDSVYITYENHKGLYRLSNLNSKEYKKIQEKISSLIEAAVVQKWKTPDNSIFAILQDKFTDYSKKKWIMPDVKLANIKQEIFNNLRVFLMNKAITGYSYKLIVDVNHATVVVTSEDREDLKVVFKLTKKTEWQVDKFYIFNREEEKILGNIPITDMAIDLNQSMIRFYKKEFEKHAKVFIEANNIYDIFSSRIKYGVALQCMGYDVNMYGDNTYYYRESNMQKYANDFEKKKYINNREFLYKFESIYDFNIISSIEKKLINSSKWMCKEGKSSEKIYQLFINDYIKLFIDNFKKNSSDIEKIKWYAELKNKYHNEVKYFEKQNFLSEMKKELQKIQKEKSRRERIKKDLDSLRKMKKKNRDYLLKQEYYQKVMAEESKWRNGEEKDMNSRIEGLIEKIKTFDKKESYSYYGFDRAKVEKAKEKERANKIKKENLVREKTNKEIKRINKVIDNNEGSNNYFNELKSAMRIDDINLTQKLLNNGADMYGKSKRNSQSPLLTAIKKNNLKIVKLFIKNGADVNYIENKMLLLGHSLGYIKMTKLLLDSGANPNLVDGYGRKLKEYLSACTCQSNSNLRKSCIEMERLLEAYGYTETREEIRKYMYYIAKTGKNINKPVDLYGRNMSPLEISEYYLYDNNLTDMLLENGANPHITYNKHFYYRTSFLNLFLDAALNQKDDKLKKYISYGVSPNYRHSGGVTSFMKFIKSGQCDRLESMKILLDNGANPNLLDDNGCSLGDGIATYCKEYPRKQKKVLELLKKYDFNDTVKNCSL